MNGVIGRHIRRERLRVGLIRFAMVLVASLIVAEATMTTPPSALLAQADTTTSASVGENPVNSLYAQLEERAEGLSEREAAIIEREIEAGIAERQRNNAVLLYSVFGLLVLVLLNSVFDFIEIRELHALERALKVRGSGD